MIHDLLSIVMPVYNSEMVLSRAIESALNQTYSRIELIIVDDGSTDGSADICHSYEEHDSRITYIYQSNAGPSAARNHGLENVHGEYLAFVDSDDWLEPDYYEKMISALRSADAQMVISNWYEHREDVINIVDIGPECILNRDALRDTIACHNIKFGGGFPWNRVICMEPLAGRIVPFREDLIAFEDKIWIIENLQFIDKIRIVNIPGYHYCVATDSLSHRFSLEKIESIFLTWDIIEDYYRKENIDIPQSVLKRESESMMSQFWSIYKMGLMKSANELWRKYHRRAGKHLTLKTPKLIVKYYILLLKFSFSG